jgi:YcxB-like protein
MEKTISLRFRYTAEEYVAATRLYLGQSRELITRLGVLFLYSIAAIALFIWIDFGIGLIPLFIVGGCFPLLLVFLLFFVIPRWRFRSDAKSVNEYFLQFSDDGIHFKTAQIDALIQWSLCNKVLENERFYILVYGKNMLSVIPKRAFANANQEAAFSQMLRRNLPAYANSKRLKARLSDAPAHSSYVPPREPPDWR